LVQRQGCLDGGGFLGLRPFHNLVDCRPLYVRRRNPFTTEIMPIVAEFKLNFAHVWDAMAIERGRNA
jgi:hypothetical protein